MASLLIRSTNPGFLLAAFLAATGSHLSAAPYYGEPGAGWGSHVAEAYWNDATYKDSVVAKLTELQGSVHRTSSRNLGAQNNGEAMNATTTAGLGDFLDDLSTENQRALMCFSYLHDATAWPQIDVEYHVKTISKWILDNGYSARIQRYDGLNEPDVNSVTTARVKQFQQWMFNAIRNQAGDSAVAIGTSAVTAVNAGSDTYLDDIIADTNASTPDSVLRYATHLSVHGYDTSANEYKQDGTTNSFWVGRAWTKMQANSPVGVKPLAVSEGGANSKFYFNDAVPDGATSAWKLRTDFDYLKWTAFSQYQWFIGMARAGVQQTCRYALYKHPTASAPDKGNNIAFFDHPTDNSLDEAPFDPDTADSLDSDDDDGYAGNAPAESFGNRVYIYDLLKNYGNADKFQWSALGAGATRTVGDFNAQQPNIYGFVKLYPWLVTFYSRPATGVSDMTKPPFVEWDSAYVNLYTAGQGRSGTAGVKMGPRSGRNQAMRLVTNLTRGKTYTVKGYVRLVQSGGQGTATLRACGWNAVPTSGAGDIVATQSTDTGSSFVLKTLASFTLSTNPRVTNNWVVIVLDHDGQGTVYWDDITITES